MSNKVVVRVRPGKDFDANVPVEGGTWARRNILHSHGPFECRKHVLEAFPGALQQVDAKPSFTIIPPGSDEPEFAASPVADDVVKSEDTEEGKEGEGKEGDETKDA